MTNIFATSVFSPMQVNKLFFITVWFFFHKISESKFIFFLGGKTMKKKKKNYQKAVCEMLFDDDLCGRNLKKLDEK